MKYWKKNNLFVIVLSLIVFFGLAVALAEAVGRVRVEAGNRATGILVEYGELQEGVNRHSLGHFDTAGALQAFQKSGITGVLLKEQTLGDLAGQGQLRIFSGAGLLAASRRGDADLFLPAGPFNPARFYVEIPDAALWERVVFHLESKVPGMVVHVAPGEQAGKDMPADQNQLLLPLETTRGSLPIAPAGVLSLPTEEERLDEIGVGFPVAAIEMLSDQGLDIYLQIYGWPGDEESLPAVFRAIGDLPGVRGILFNSPDLPGFPVYRAVTASEMDRLGIPVVTIDLFERQRAPLLSLVRSQETKEVIRLHAIPQEERDLLTPARALSRYLLAVTERNNRLLLIRYGGQGLYGAPWLEKNTDFVVDLRGELAAAGHAVGTVIPYAGGDFPFSRAKIFLISAAILAGGVLLLIRLKMARAGFMLGAAGLLLVGFLLASGGKFLGFDSLDLARKGMALASGTIFPLLGLAVYRDCFGKRSLPKALGSLVGLSLFSLAGALLAAGLMTGLTYMVKLDQLPGIKLALFLPLLLAGMLLLFGDERSLRGLIGKLRELWDRPLITGSALLIVLLLVAAAVLLVRSGNESLFVSEAELHARFLLDRLLVVRPRTKEFLIGHPLMLVAFYWGLRSRAGIWVALLGMIGQVSLINTFYHLHTPLLISLQRAAGGLILGAALGVVLILGLKIIFGIVIGREGSPPRRG
ncbi:MAG TPA: hypothetical protein GXZ24_10005 [Firmicutes bacterium]|nr:hypothetical protein [Bacillota bacterium]